MRQWQTKHLRAWEGPSAKGGEKSFDICGRDVVGGVAEADKESKNDVGVQR